ncbi:sodium-dependent multivitamin transporter [Caerostris extrusa]|uniref:Sodium-dependent multivitamin transporter n=1 Tax=Caerostris extrusa TaxID=172846 RepID=A0AAV4Q1D3_CAEEX|nr:sodium-dependent multivitamin transporter [Caerostris extrusa]
MEINRSFLVQALFYGVLSLVLTYLVSSFGNVLQASTIVYGFVAGPTLGVFLLGVLTARTNEKGAVIGLTASLLLTAWISFGSSSTNTGHSQLPVSTAGCPSNNNFTTTTTASPLTTLGPPVEDRLPETCGYPVNEKTDEAAKSFCPYKYHLTTQINEECNRVF